MTLSDRELCRVYHTNETTLRLQSALLPAAGKWEVPIAGSAAKPARAINLQEEFPLCIQGRHSMQISHLRVADNSVFSEFAL